MKNGWRMKEIDEMDMLGFLRLRAWDARREQEKKKPRQRFIDEVWPGVEFIYRQRSKKLCTESHPPRIDSTALRLKNICLP